MSILALTHPRKFLMSCAALVALMYGCGEPPPPPDTRAADEAAIMKADAAWSEAAGSKNLDASLAFLADDIKMFPPNEAIVEGKDAVRKTWEAMYAMPGFALRWAPTKAVAARSGDLGYVYGTYEFSFNDAQGNPVTDNGKYLEVWAKQADGSWKVTADIFNSSVPMAPPPAATP